MRQVIYISWEVLTLFYSTCMCVCFASSLVEAFGTLKYMQKQHHSLNLAHTQPLTFLPPQLVLALAGPKTLPSGSSTTQPAKNQQARPRHIQGEGEKETAT